MSTSKRILPLGAWRIFGVSPRFAAASLGGVLCMTSCRTTPDAARLKQECPVEPVGMTPSSSDHGVMQSTRSDIGFRGWQPSTGEFPSILSNDLSGEWVAESEGSRYRILHFHTNGRLDVHLGEGHVWYFAYQFWQSEPSADRDLMVKPWSTNAISLPTPMDSSLLHDVTMAKTNGVMRMVGTDTAFDTSSFVLVRYVH